MSRETLVGSDDHDGKKDVSSILPSHYQEFILPQPMPHYTIDLLDRDLTGLAFPSPRFHPDTGTRIPQAEGNWMKLLMMGCGELMMVRIDKVRFESLIARHPDTGILLSPEEYILGEIVTQGAVEPRAIARNTDITVELTQQNKGYFIDLTGRNN